MYITEMGKSGEKVVKTEQYLDPQKLSGYVLGKGERYNKLHSSQYLRDRLHELFKR